MKKETTQSLSLRALMPSHQHRTSAFYVTPSLRAERSTLIETRIAAPSSRAHDDKRGDFARFFQKSMPFWILIAMLFGLNPALSAKQQDTPLEIHGTIVTASNNGTDFNIVNDTFRDELMKLFSYSAYEQDREFVLKLVKSERQRMELPGGYELMLTLQDVEKGRVYIQAVIRKDNEQYLDTVLSILNPGVVFVGGPAVPEKGDLIIVLETGF